MGACVGDLEPRQIERLRIELAEALVANFAYLPFFNYRTDRSTVRPVDRAKRSEIDQFLQSVNLAPLDRVDVTSPEVRRFLERLLLRYLEVNATFARPRFARRLPELRSRVPRVAADVQRGLIAFVGGTAPAFGTRQPQPSWAESPQREGMSHEESAHNTRVLEAVLLRREDEPLPPHKVSSPPAPPVRKTTSGPAATPPPPVHGTNWASAVFDATIPVPAQGGPLSGFDSPFAGLELGAQSTAFGVVSSIADSPTGPLPVVQTESDMSGNPAFASSHAQAEVKPRELPPELYQMYGDYLRDMQPEAPIAPPPPTHRSAPPAPVTLDEAPRPEPARPPIWQDGALSQPAHPTPTPEPSASTRSDNLIFWQLRYQLEAYVRRASRSYGIQLHSDDPSSVLDALRRSGFVDEADLRIAEGILALTDRVTAAGAASLDDYRQALMLYLLYHRSHLNT